MCLKVNKVVYKESCLFTSIKTVLMIATLYILTMTKDNDNTFYKVAYHRIQRLKSQFSICYIYTEGINGSALTYTLTILIAIKNLCKFFPFLIV